MIDLPVVFDRRPWGLVVVSGPDATSFLQAIVSQDLAPVRVGDTVPSLLLQPQGKLDVAFRATRRTSADAGDVWWLDTEPEYGPRLAAGLGRYKIRVQVELEDRTASTAMASVVGVVAGGVPASAVEVAVRWGDLDGTDVIATADEIAAWIPSVGVRLGAPSELEALRVESGVPALGVDVDDSTIPQEAFLERDAVSFTKGCFIGQELVCRIDVWGHVNRFLRRLTLDGDTVPPRGADVVVGDRAVGAVTSAAAVPGEQRVVALAMVRREVEPPADVTIRGDRDLSATVVA